MKTVVITGSTRGIGRGLAENFLKKDCRVVISGRSQQAVEQVVAELESEYPGRVAGRHCEITSAADIQSLWNAACEAFGGVDVWINNAGMSIARKPLAEQPVSELEKIVATNLTGLLIANKVVLAEMLKKNHGQIWNMEGFGSTGQSAPGMVAYGATKRALNYVNGSLQKEIKGTNVQVNTLSPGIVVTDLLVGDYDLASDEWRKTKKILNILGDTVETVTPFLVDGVLKTAKSGARVAWLTTGKAFARFLTAGFNKRDLFVEHEAQVQQSV
ncbi:SDR family NAD(P)-dependent oxidoreductase [Microbulbifer bruguierae]|uniref:SDR family NAD(P)-dependent oxidoreductase n=1 Tax=Microbulbifer bruguierae TaxID=3029061 RepID=A0ABY8NEK7_9GAMM|nr:SDR family oxidoreductase [Microbulbifer bruguierae]WGL16824.1 SDR family NAD(P)-dependent oxidoreductase [Microbulbifer bruguierae]